MPDEDKDTLPGETPAERTPPERTPPMVATVNYVRTTSLPPEMREGFERVWVRWNWLVPTWVQQIAVNFANDRESEATARMRSSIEYRWAELELLPKYLTRDEEQRDGVLIHELAHLNQAPLQRWGEDVIKLLEGMNERALATHLRETFTRALEESTTDWSRAIHARLHPDGPTK
jgi:hypothetical protein